VEYLVQQQRLQGNSLVTLRGNHEDILLRFLDEPETYGPEWLPLGGAATLMSYGVNVSGGKVDFAAVRREFAERLPLDHLVFLQGLRLSYELHDFFFSHAGARPGVTLLNQKERDLLWTRWRQSQGDVIFEKVVVHGHTPVEKPEVAGCRINVDTGAYATGRLSALKITPEGVGFLTAAGTQP
jgi:serine/threonine protein phosphatase 1